MAPETLSPAPVLRLEHVTCSRCGGSGHYSYTQRLGTLCAKCLGAGTVYTKRGRAARDYLDALRSKPARELQVGDPCKMSSGRGRLLSSRVDDDGLMVLEFKHCTYHGIRPDAPIAVIPTRAFADETLRMALAYQETCSPHFE